MFLPRSDLFLEKRADSLDGCRDRIWRGKYLRCLDCGGSEETMALCMRQISPAPITTTSNFSVRLLMLNFGFHGRTQRMSRLKWLIELSSTTRRDSHEYTEYCPVRKDSGGKGTPTTLMQVRAQLRRAHSWEMNIVSNLIGAAPDG